MKQTIILLLLLAPLVSMNKGMGSQALVPKKDESVEPTPVVIELTTEERIVAILKDSGFSHSMQRIILAQAKHESGGFTSRLARQHNNIFGMKHPGRGPTYSRGPYARAEGRKGYASYLSIDSAVTDYIMYKRRRQIENAIDAKTYVYHLKKKHYFEAKPDRYLRAVERWMLSDSTVRNF